MYLKTLYRIHAEREVARVRDLAESLGVSPGTVTEVLKKLERRHLVNHERYGAVALTAAGNRVAECVLRRFQTLRDVLIEGFGIDPETASADACLMEHAVSPITVNRMGSFLRRVRAGEVPRPHRGGHALRRDSCSKCEALGVCQAEAAAR
jgi:DtxR family Mn-dependent transcriptional regulator